MRLPVSGSVVHDRLPGLDPEPVTEADCLAGHLYAIAPDDDFVLDRHGPLVIMSPWAVAETRP
ncbi:hypothetical protein ABZZ80_27160 [Streptomyces sp. NPDC006356]